MARRMSFAMTTPQVLDRSKTVTRRLGWAGLKAGDELVAVRSLYAKEVLCRILVVSVRQERLDAITAADVRREGFHDRTPAEFVAFFCEAFECTPDVMVRRIEFRYLDRDERDTSGGARPGGRRRV